MSAKVIKLDCQKVIPENLKEAAGILAKGGLVIIPTETVYGIAANMLNDKTMERLSEIKKRPKDKPFSVHICEKQDIENFAKDIPINAYKLIDKFWPGPLTIVLKSKDKGTVGPSVSLRTNGERSRTIGLRLPDNNIAREIIKLSGVAVVCPSANIPGKPAPINFGQAIEDLKGLVDFAIDSGETKLKIESSVVDLTSNELKILREAAIKKDELEAVIKKKNILFVCTGNSCRSVMAKGLLEKKLKDLRRTEVEVLSAGVATLAGLGATEYTAMLLAQEGIDVSSHRSQKITSQMVHQSDLVLVMEKLQEEKVLQIAPSAKNRVFLLKEFANPVRNTHVNSLAKISNGTKIKDNNDLDVVDPIGKSEEFYAATFNLIKEAIERISKVI